MGFLERVFSSKKKSLVFFVALTILVFFPVYYLIEDYYVHTLCQCQLEMVVPALVLISTLSTSVLVALALFLGALVIEKRENKKYNILAGVVGAKHESFEHILRKLLSDKEMRVLQALAARDGKVRQTEIGTATGFSRVEVHRAISSLEQKGLVKRTKQGRTFIIEMDPEMLELLGTNKEGE